MLIFKPSNEESPRSFMKIYDGETLIRDFVVCRNPEGKIGMFDRVSNCFVEFTNVIDLQFDGITYLLPDDATSKGEDI